MANLSKIKRDEMIAFLEQLKQEHTDDASIRAFNEIKNHLLEKKYGLVWEEHSEEVDEMLKENIPVLTADPERRLCKDENLPWNFIIEGDNLQALYLLEKTHRGKIDCIYIDPPYNTGATDWKYNNRYVDTNDTYRHSKWLSMMNCRLEIAKKLLNSRTGVLILTIDENEVHNIRALLEAMFPQAIIQMITCVINPKGIFQGKFTRVEEYVIFCFMPEATICPGTDPLLGEKTKSKKPRWKGLLRSGSKAARAHTESEFYPILIDSENKRIVKALSPIGKDVSANYGEKIEGYDVAWPIRSDMSEGLWGVTAPTLNELISQGFVSLGKYDSKRDTWGISYLTSGLRKKIETGELVVVGYDEVKNVVDVEYAVEKDTQIKTVWYRTTHDAGAYGTDLITKILGKSGAFSFPKSLYSEKDAISTIVKKNPNAVVLDFFAGSGTTLNAVNLINAEDGGQRTCILVTNNECFKEEEDALKAKGYKKGDAEWESHGIAKSVTWPRSKYSIMGKRDDGTVIEGEYLTSKTIVTYKKRNVTQIGFVNDLSVLSKPQIKQLATFITDGILPQKLIDLGTKYIVSDDEKHTASILFDIAYAQEWIDELAEQDHITDLFIVTTNSKAFKTIKERVSNQLDDIVISELFKIPMSDGFNANLKYFKCDWTPRKPEDYLLSNALCLHIREMIELQNAIEIDDVKNVLILNKSDFRNTILNPTVYDQIRNVWVNQNIVLNAEELKLLEAKGYKYIPKEFFGQELREAAE